MVLIELALKAVQHIGDLGEAGFLGDRLVLMQRGRIVQEDTFQGLLDRPANDFVTNFINAQRPPQVAQRELR